MVFVLCGAGSFKIDGDHFVVKLGTVHVLVVY
jgi:hypothetical protein